MPRQTHANTTTTPKPFANLRVFSFFDVALHAIELGSFEALHTLLDSPYAEHFDSEQRRRLLLRALDSASLACAIHLFNQTSDEDCAAIGWESLMVSAVYAGPVILSAVVDRAKKGSKAFPRLAGAALRTAAAANLTETLKILIEAGAPLNSAAPCGSTALHMAADEHSRECMKLLIQAGADIERLDKSKISPLAASAGSLFLEGITILLAAGAQPNPPAPAIHPLCELDYDYCSSRSILLCVQALLNAGATPNLFLHCGRTPLCIAIEGGNYPTMHALLGAGADPFSESTKQPCAMASAVKARDREAILAMLEAGADWEHSSLTTMAAPDGSKPGERFAKSRCDMANLREIARRARWSKIARFIDLETERRALDSISRPGKKSMRLASI